MTDRRTLEALVNDDIVANGLPDAGLLKDYLDRNCPFGDPIFLSLGETWTQIPDGLVQGMQVVPRHAHGYQLSMHGLPALRRAVRDYVTTEHRLAEVSEPGRDFEVAVTWTGTRALMFDFGRYLADESADDPRTPVVLAAGPGWDYAGVFTPQGYRMRYLALRPERDFQPDAEECAELIDEIVGRPDERLALVVINAQHNPTAANWSPGVVASLVQGALDHGAAVLVDDPYFAVHDDGVKPTAALRILLEELHNRDDTARQRWLAVRSLGKQFHCNGWGIGAVTADPRTLHTLSVRYRFHHSLTYAGVQQQAMADWLTDPASTEYLAAQRVDYAAKRRMVTGLTRTALRHPETRIVRGECTSYQLLAVPPAYAQRPDGVEEFRRACFATTGVLLSPAWMMPEESIPAPYVRMYLGPPQELIRTAMDRMAAAGLHYDCTP